MGSFWILHLPENIHTSFNPKLPSPIPPGVDGHFESEEGACVEQSSHGNTQTYARLWGGTNTSHGSVDFPLVIPYILPTQGPQAAESLSQIRQIRNESSQELREENQETRRHTGVLVEDLHHKLDLVVEGHQFIRQQIQDIRSELKLESQETRA